jgi:serine/threonine-protein kinase RsbW
MIQQFSASLDHLHDMLRFICHEGMKAGFQESKMYHIELAVEEALVNIIEYAHLEKNEVIEIECDFDKQENFFVIISDKGIPYNPLNVGKVSDITSVVDSQPVGGYGIFFILKMMDEVRYAYEGGKNILTLVKHK